MCFWKIVDDFRSELVSRGTNLLGYAMHCGVGGIFVEKWQLCGPIHDRRFTMLAAEPSQIELKETWFWRSFRSPMRPHNHFASRTSIVFQQRKILGGDCAVQYVTTELIRGLQNRPQIWSDQSSFGGPFHGPLRRTHTYFVVQSAIADLAWRLKFWKFFIRPCFNKKGAILRVSTGILEREE